MSANCRPWLRLDSNCGDRHSRVGRAEAEALVPTRQRTALGCRRHRSEAQRSEFDTVWLLLPARDNRVLSRELVYTGITRARSELHVAGSEAVICEALAWHANRWSGLEWRLGSG